MIEFRVEGAPWRAVSTVHVEAAGIWVNGKQYARADGLEFRMRKVA